MRFLPTQLATLNRLKCDWHWHLIEGVAQPVKCTSWCKRLPPRLSVDGTTQFLNSLRGHPKITVKQQQSWPGKNAMVNTALQQIKEPCCLSQIDVDELYTPAQLETIATLFDKFPNHNVARFWCRYFVGSNLITIGEGYGNRKGEWVRAWRFEPGMRSITHEPPVMNITPRMIEREETERLGLVFDHHAYCYPEQVRLKEIYYGYKNALSQWQALQRHPGPWPVELHRYLTWVPRGTMATRIFQ